MEEDGGRKRRGKAEKRKRRDKRDDNCIGKVGMESKRKEDV